MSFFQDVRYAIRLLLKSPGFTLVVVAALAAGIGVNATVFTLVNAVLFRGLPFERPDEIMYLVSDNLSKGTNQMWVSYPDFQDWRAQAKSFRGMGAFDQFGANLTEAPASPERFEGARLSANVFSLIGQKPLLGRDFQPEDEKAGAPPVVILGYSVWQNRYGGDHQILGRTVRLNETATTVIGVMPEGMKFPVRQDLWTPIDVTKAVADRGERHLSVFGRLAPGASLASARVEMSLIAKRLEREYAATNQGVGVVVRPYNDVFNGGRIRLIFLSMLGAVGFVLLIACANVANLQLSRSMSRLREVSIRTALGASRWRVIRQLLIESIILGVLGGVVGLGIVLAGTRAFDVALANVGKPYWIRFTVDYTVFGYLAAICILAGIVSGLLPALAASRVDLNTTLKEGGRGSAGTARGQWASGVLVTAEFALSLMLLVSAGLMMRSLVKSYDTVSRYDLDHTMVAWVGTPENTQKDEALRLAFWDHLRPQVRSLPGAGTVVLSSTLPGAGADGWKIEVESDHDHTQAISGVVVSPGYFECLGIRLLRGRDFLESDGEPGRESVVVNQHFVAKYFPTGDPVGRRVRLVGGDGKRPWMAVVGVSENIQQDVWSREGEAVAYVPYRQQVPRGMLIVAHPQTTVATLIPALRTELHRSYPDLSLVRGESLREGYARDQWQLKVFGSLFVVFAAIALVLAAVGLFAVVAYNVGRRTPEIGLRMALGATPAHILRLVLRGAVWQLGIGTAIGLAGAFALSRVMQGILQGVSATDPLTFSVVTPILIAAGAAACWLPARRAAKVDPTEALRYE